MTQKEKSNTRSLAEIAHTYIYGGMQCHPCYPPTHKDSHRAGKIPKIKAWQKTRLSAEEFTDAYSLGDNLGVVTGRASGLVVVDIDPRNGGMRWFHQHEHGEGEGLGNYLLEETGSGGLHLYYRYPQSRRGSGGGVSSRTGLFPGVDFLADGGKQVVTWPSVHRESRQYRIPSGMTLLDVEHEMDEPPAWLLELVGEAEGEKAPSSVLPPSASVLDQPTEITRVKEMLSTIPAAITGAAGDLHTYRAACLCRDYGLSPATALGAMKDIYNPRCIPPWEEKQLREKVKNAYRYARGNAGEATAAAQFMDAGTPEDGEEPPPLTPEQLEVQEDAIAGDPKSRYLLSRPIACADLFILRQEGRLRFSEDVGYLYDGQENIWRFITDTELRSMIERDICTLSPRAHRSLKLARIKEIAELVKIRLQHERFDTQLERWIACPSGDGTAAAVRVGNGVLGIETGELMPHTLNWFSFNKLPFDHTPDASCPHFTGFIRSIWGEDSDIKDCLQLWFGYMILAHTREQRFAIFIGASRAGKGVLTRLIEKVLGESTCAAATLTSLAGEFGLESLIGKRLVIFHDAYKAHGALGDLATERLVSIVGRDRQVVNRKYRQSISCVLPVNVMLVCNELPRFVNARGALSNRMIIFPFSESFAGKEDLALEERLEKELPGIFNWALEGARRLLAGETLKSPERAEETLAEVIKQLDPLLGWKEERITVTISEEWDDGPEVSTPTGTLYEDYKRWCTDNGHHALSRNRFTVSLQNHLPKEAVKKKVRTGLRTYWAIVNVRLLELEDAVEFH